MSSFQAPLGTAPEIQQCEIPPILLQLARVLVAWTWTDIIVLYALCLIASLLTGLLHGLLTIFLEFYVKSGAKRFFNYLYGRFSKRTDNAARHGLEIVPAPVDRPDKVRIIQADGENGQSRDKKRHKEDVDVTFYVHMNDFKRGRTSNEITMKAVFVIEDREDWSGNEDKEAALEKGYR